MLFRSNDITMLEGKTQSIPISNDGEYSKMESSSSTEGILQFYGPSTINAKSVGTTTLTVTLTNYDGTTVSGSCTVTVKELKYTTIDDSYGYISSVTYSSNYIKFRFKAYTSKLVNGLTKNLIGKISIPPVRGRQTIELSPSYLHLVIDPDGKVFIENVSPTSKRIEQYHDGIGTEYSYFAVIQ